MKKVLGLLFAVVAFAVGMSGVSAATIKVSKVEIGTNKAITGSIMTLSKPKVGSAGGDIVEVWTTDGTEKVIEVEPGTYLLRENYPASGYLNADDVTIVIKDADEVYTLKSESDYTKAEFGAIDKVTGEFVAGVKFQLLASDGTVYTSWTSEKKVHHIDRVPLDTYTLKVVSVPNGYQIAEEKTVVIDELCKNVQLFKVDLPSSSVPTPTPTPEEPKPEEPKEEITEVPDTNSNTSMFIYGLGLAITVCGSGLIYKHVKEN